MMNIVRVRERENIAIINEMTLNGFTCIVLLEMERLRIDRINIHWLFLRG